MKAAWNCVWCYQPLAPADDYFECQHCGHWPTLPREKCQCDRCCFAEMQEDDSENPNQQGPTAWEETSVSA